MTSIKVRDISFVDQKITEKTYEFASSLEIKSPKTLAYVIRWQLARNRAGTAKTKTMSEISGTTAKPWKQKGTGRARQGSKRSVQFVGGRTCHGPMPRNFDFSIPKKIANLAINDSIKSKLASNLVYTFIPEAKEIKTSLISKLFIKNKIKSALIITEENSRISLCARNIKNTKVIDPCALNALDLVNYENIIIDKQTFETKIIGALN